MELRRHTFMTISRDLIGYLGELTLSGGDHDGEPFKVLPWEARFIRGAFGVKGPAAMALARANGKSCLVAGIAAAVTDPTGPLHGNRRECVCVASSFEQSRIIFEDVLSFLRPRHDLGNRQMWRLQDSANRALIEHRPSGARVRCIGSDPSKAHGLRPALALMDEPAQHDSAKTERMLAAIKTSMGKLPNSKMIALGTRPAASEHWFSKMLFGGGGYSQVHAARPTDPPFQKRTWRKANPSLDHLPSLLAEIRDEAEHARSDPGMLAAFQSLRLNLGTSDTMVQGLLDAGFWERIEGDAPATGPCVWGVDLGTNAAMSAIACYHPDTGRLEVLSAFPNEPSLAERGLRDGVGRLYAEGWKRGELVQVGGEAVDIAELLSVAMQRFGPPGALSSDRWREAEFRDSLKRAGVPRAALILRGQGFKDGAEDVRIFRRAALEGYVTPIKSLILTSAMSEARCITDAAGNSKLAKGSEGQRRLRARDDAVAASILAVSLGRRRAAKPTTGIYLGAVG